MNVSGKGDQESLIIPPVAPRQMRAQSMTPGLSRTVLRRGHPKTILVVALHEICLPLLLVKDL